jgi:glycosyltransferase involved in cell wall biosynthesis
MCTRGMKGKQSGAFLKRVFNACSGYAFEVIIVDDNSPDGTQDVIKQLQALYGTSTVVRLCRFIPSRDTDQGSEHATLLYLC